MEVLLEVNLTADDAITIRRLARSVGREYGSSDDAGLLRDLNDLVREMPAVAAGLPDYMESPEADVVVIHNHMVSDVNLGPTPTSWKAPRATATSLEYEMVVMLYGALLGSVFGWETQQDGHIVNDIIPSGSSSDQQARAGSDVELAWHAGDAFHPGRADYVCLFCLRNPNEARTTVASLVEVPETEPLPPVLSEVVLKPGDLLVLGNRRAVHGRRPFQPTFSDRDSWLKQLMVAVDFESRSPYCADASRRLLA
ncbi:MAG TPA: hypothetical protein VFS64_02520 [Solirubrobacterales bacterium]|nr:hypothetical protein [Solirubrobacterales bacterium]